jgi:hypothetical protein
VVFRSRGGGNRLLNRTTVCAAHHQHHIHAGGIRAERLRNGAIAWWLGIGKGTGGRTFLRLIGDTYLELQALVPAAVVAKEVINRRLAS